MATQATTRVTVTKLGKHVGARIDGVHLGGSLDASVVEQIHQALLRHKVIFFRGQHQLDDEQQEAFAKLLGGPSGTVANRIPGFPRTIYPIDSDYDKATFWHSEFTFAINYPRAAILRAITLPTFGGSTLWASTAAAYAALPEPLKRLTENLWALHSNRYDQLGHIRGMGTVLIPGGSAVRYGATEEADQQAGLQKALDTLAYRTEHPVVRVHPETGEQVLVLGGWVRAFVGLGDYESRVLFELLQSRITLPENTIRWRWEPGDVAVWDNYATQHRAVDDYDDDQHRVMHRIALAGEVPADIHGRRSRAVSGGPLESIAG